MLVYDATDRGTFDNIPTWMLQIQAMCSASQVVLIGNKSDLLEKMQVTEAEGIALAQRYGVPFFATTAKNNHNVLEAFTAVARLSKTRAKARLLSARAVHLSDRRFGISPASGCAC
jgi:GTPase SAR1 family protein